VRRAGQDRWAGPRGATAWANRTKLRAASPRADLELSDQNWLFYDRRSRLRPCQSVEQQCQLRRRKTDRPISHRRPDELAALQPFRCENHAAAVPCQQLDPIISLRTE